MSDHEPTACTELLLDSLKQEKTVITSESAGYFIEAAMYCFDSQDHSSGVSMGVKTDKLETCFDVYWKNEVTEKIKRLFRGNGNQTTEQGATTLALLILPLVTEFTSIEEAPVGTTVDYFLVSDESDDTYIFDNIEAYCEIRGIRRESKGNTIRGAITEKARRLKKGRETGAIGDLPTYIVIVEFNKPFSRVTVR